MEQRRHDRHEIEEPAFMRVLAIGGGAYVVTLLDVSRHGMRIRCSRELPEGTQVEVRCRRSLIAGEVRYARSVEVDEIHLGILAKSVSGNSEDFDLTMLFPDLIEP